MKFFSTTFVLLAFILVNAGFGIAGRQAPEEYWGAAMGGEAMPEVIKHEVEGAEPSDQKFLKSFDTAANVIIYHGVKFRKNFDTKPTGLLYHAKNHAGETASEKVVS